METDICTGDGSDEEGDEGPGEGGDIRSDEGNNGAFEEVVNELEESLWRHDGSGQSWPSGDGAPTGQMLGSGHRIRL